jgi:hypothetical protein
MDSGQYSGSQAPIDRTASNPAVTRPCLEITCIDSMQAFFVRAGCRVSTSTAVKSIGSRTRSGSAAVTRAIEARQRGQAPSKRTRKAG